MEASSNMKSFENQWADAFESVEMAPSEQLWIKIDSGLANTEASKYRSGIIFYRLLAAASLFIALGLGITLLMQDSNVTEGESFTQTNESPEIENEIPATIDQAPTITDRNDQVETRMGDEILPEDEQNEVFDDVQMMATADDEGFLRDESPTVDVQSEPVELISLLSKRSKEDEFSIETVDHIYNLPVVVAKVKPLASNQLWAGLGVSSGSFNPNIGSGNFENDAALFAEDFSEARTVSDAVNASNESYDGGISYSIAANAGWRFAPRWILQSGLQYQFAQSNTRTNTLIQNNSTNESFAGTVLGPQAEGSFEQYDVVNSDVKLNNNFQFLSIPLRVGYLVLDRKFQIGINTGVSSDFFLKNKVSESNELVEDFDQRPGDASPYSKTFFSGLLGVELGYNFLGQYYLTAEPSYRRALNSFTKQGTGLMSNPSGLGLTIGFRYLFE